MNILTQVMDGLEYIHGKSVLHRDIAPDNIFVTGSGMVKILDFGAARREMMQANRELTGFIKVGFAPVEQYGGHGAQGSYSDIYALGATFYTLFTGRMSTESTSRVETDTLIPLSKLRPDLPDNLKYCIEKCMAVRVADRVQNVAEMRQILGISAEKPQMPAAGTQTRTMPKTAKSNPPPKQETPPKGGLAEPGVGKRFVAVLLDALIWLPFVAAAMYVNPFLGLLFPPVIVLMHAFLETQLGATVGKLIMRLRVVDGMNAFPGFGQAMVRNLIKLLGVFVVIFAKDGRLLEDTQSDTRVVRV